MIWIRGELEINVKFLNFLSFRETLQVVTSIFTITRRQRGAILEFPLSDKSESSRNDDEVIILI